MSVFVEAGVGISKMLKFYIKGFIDMQGVLWQAILSVDRSHSFTFQLQVSQTTGISK